MSTTYFADPDVQTATACVLGDDAPELFETKALLWTRNGGPGSRDAAANAVAALFAARPDLVWEVSAEMHGDKRRAYSRGIVRLIEGLEMDAALDALFHARPADPEEWKAILDQVPDEGRFASDALVGLAGQPIESVHARVVGEILVHRGEPAGYRVLLHEGDAREWIGSLIDQGPSGVRQLCVACDGLDYGILDEVAEQLAGRRKKTQATVYEIARQAKSGEDLLALQTLGYWDAPESVEILLGVIRDGALPEDVHNHAIEALCRLEAPEAMDTLCEVLLDPKMVDWVRLDCAYALGEIGNWNALPALEAAAKADPKGHLGERARAAIARIEG